VIPWELEPGCVRLKLDHPEAELRAAAGMPHAVVPLADGYVVEAFDKTWAGIITRLRKRAPELFKRRQDSG
jgi:hypothetical protein